TPGGISKTVTFGAQYLLGVKVDGGVELVPRTPFTSTPYSLNAATADSARRAFSAQSADRAVVADTAADVRGGFVASLNGKQGVVTIVGAGSTTVTQTGNQIKIASPQVGGITEITNSDGTIGIVAAQGPVVDLQLQNNSVSTLKLT